MQNKRTRKDSDLSDPGRPRKHCNTENIIFLARSRSQVRSNASEISDDIDKQEYIMSQAQNTIVKIKRESPGRAEVKEIIKKDKSKRDCIE